MRIVSFGDVHMALGMIERLGQELAVADLVIVSGDLTNYTFTNPPGWIASAVPPW